jgi:hypothetical protein
MAKAGTRKAQQGWWGLALVAGLIFAACNTAEPPDSLPILHLHGTPYQRGFQHGSAMASEVRSFYTTMLSTSLLPYLNRQQPDIAAFLKSYDSIQHPEYGSGQFSYQLLSESALELEKSIPADLVAEMHGIADGASVPYMQVLMLNTFVDSVMGARAITQYLQQIQSPVATQFSLAGAASATASGDGIDNDEDGQTDELAECTLPYAPTAVATLRDVPLNSAFRFVLKDADGIDQSSVRVQLVVAGKLRTYTQKDAQLAMTLQGSGSKPDPTAPLEVVLTPPEPLPAAAIVTIAVQASDAKLVLDPPPAKARTMRIEQVTVTTAGFGKPLPAAANLGLSDGTTQPTSLAFALRKAATKDGGTLLAAHFSLLDAGTSHKHCVIQIHQPDSGPPFAFVGWAGLAYGFSGMSARGVAIAANHSDTLNNPLVAAVKKKLLLAKLVDTGIPVGFAVRQALQAAKTAKEAADMLVATPQSFGWNYLVADASGDLRAVEALGGIEASAPHTVAYPADARDSAGSYLSSVRGDDVLTTVHYRALADDFTGKLLGFNLQPQRFWDTYYYASLRTYANLAHEIDKGYGMFDAKMLQGTLRTASLVDPHDSMQASIADLAARVLWVAAGQVPATNANFVKVTLPAWSEP